VIFDKEKFPAQSILTDPANCVPSSGKSPGLFFTHPSHIFTPSSSLSPTLASSSLESALARGSPDTHVTLNFASPEIYSVLVVISPESHLHPSLSSLNSGQPKIFVSFPLSPAPILSHSSDHQDSATLNLQNDIILTYMPSTKIITRSQTGHLKPCRSPDFHSYSNCHPLQALHAGLVYSEPCSYAQAALIPEWCTVMDNEFQSLLRMKLGHFVLVLLVRMWFHVNGFLNSNGDLATMLNVTKLD